MSKSLSQHEIAVIGLSCRFPNANSPEEYWKLLKQGENTIRSIPDDRLKRHSYVGLKTRYASFMDNAFHFDPEYFKISEEEAKIMDPQQRLMLELAVETFENAGFSEIDNRNIGVFIGASQRSYIENVYDNFSYEQLKYQINNFQSFAKLPEEHKRGIIKDLDLYFQTGDLHASTVTGNLTNMVAGRISHQFNLSGPSMSIDTACSSALVAVHLACKSLINKECDSVLAGGVNLNLTPSMFLLMESAGVVSNSGRSIPFSADSDGIVLGEGAGLVMLRRLKDAERDGDNILAVIKGSGINNDGYSLGVMTPSWKGQLSLLQKTYDESGFDRNGISMVEAHGTSTRIGDSVEITVLKHFFGEDHSLSIGSSKSNLGHMLTASGIAGLIKTLLCIQHQKKVCSLTSGEINPRWKLNDSKFYIQEGLEDWDSEGPRAAGINAFGFGGTNAHVILEEYSGGNTIKTIQSQKNTLFSKRELYAGRVIESKPIKEAFYQLLWEEKDSLNGNPVNSSSRWIVFCDHERLGVANGLIEKDKISCYVHRNEAFIRSGQKKVALDIRNSDHLDWLFQSFQSANSILYVPYEVKDKRAIIDHLHFLKNIWTKAKALPELRQFNCITKEAFSIDNKSYINPYMHSLSTLFNVGYNENKKIKGGLIDLESYGEEELLELKGLLSNEGKETLVIRNKRIWSPKLVAKPLHHSSDAELRLKYKGNYLILGASSGIGLLMARYLRKKYDAILNLTGRRSLDQVNPWIRKNTGQGVSYHQVSVEDEKAMQGLFNSLYESLSKLDGIIFTAGKKSVGSLNTLDVSAFNETLGPKITGLNLLESLTEKRDVGFVYLMSSISSITPGWGTGLGAYATANAYLNAVAIKNRNLSTKWFSRSWTIWENTGMSENISSSAQGDWHALHGDEAISFFEKSMAFPLNHLVILHHTDSEKFDFSYSPRMATSDQAKAINKTDSSQDLSEIETDSDFVQLLKQLVALETDLPEDEIDVNDSFTELGLDSISALDIAAKLEKDFELVLDPTLLFEYDTIQSLGNYLSEQLNTAECDEESHPLLPSQLTFFANEQFYPDEACNSQSTLHFNIKLIGPTLQQAFDQVVKDHEALRTRFKMSKNGPVQLIKNFASISIEEINLKNSDDFEKVLVQLEEKYINKKYSLDQAILFDLVLLSNEKRSALIFSAHHILLDGWSVGILFRDLLTTYFQLLQDPNYSVNSNSKLYRSFLSYEREKTYGTKDREVLDYWEKELKDLQKVELSKNKLFDAINSYSFKRIELNETEVKKLEKLAAQKGLSLFLLIFAAYFKTLSQCYGNTDITVRLASEKRDRKFEGYENLICCLADSIPIRLKDIEEMNVFQMAQKIKKKISLAFQYPLEDPTKLSRIIASKSHDAPSVVSQFGISYINADHFLKNQSKGVDKIFSKVNLPFTELSLIILKQRGMIDLSLHYDQKDIDSDDPVKLLKGIIGILVKPDSQHIPAVQRSWMNVLEMPEDRFFSDLHSIHARIFQACDQFSEQIALRGEKNLTYRELKSGSLGVAQALLENGCKKHKLIGILDYPGSNAILGVLGILTAGKAYVPLDPDWPEDRIKSIIEQAKVKSVVTSTAQLHKLQAQKIDSLENIILVGSVTAVPNSPEGIKIIQVRKRGTNDIEFDIDEDHRQSMAYVMYTSGTTGKPKGVMVRHGAVMTFLNWLDEEFHFNQNDRFIQSSSLGFGGSLRQMFSTLLRGGEMHPIERSDFKDPQSLIEFLGKNKITLLNTVPSVLQSICDYIEEEYEEKRVVLEHLRLVLIGGERFYTDLARSFFRLVKGPYKLYNLYGSTETIVNASLFKVERDKEYPDILPIGRARKGSHVLLLDEKGELCRNGEKGILYVGGPSIAEGYYLEPEMTAEKFRELSIPGCKGKYFNTGDVAFRDNNGILNFTGRADDQFQLYGNRIEPSEIESLILGDHRIKQVSIVPDITNKRQRIVAFIVKNNSGIPVEALDVREMVAAKLPRYMIPHEVVFVDNIALNQAGKTDRNSLKVKLQSEKQQKSSRGLSKIHEDLVEIWMEVLNLNKVEYNQDFFALGGDSIQALQILYRIRKRYPVAPKPIDLFRRRTIMELADLLEELNPEDERFPKDKEHAEILEKASDQNKKFPLTINQRGFYLLDKTGKSGSPNQFVLLPLHGSVEEDLLKKCFQYLVEKHAMLRTRFVRSGKDIYQEIADQIEIDLEIHDHSHLEERDKSINFQKRLRKIKVSNFELDQLPLFKIALIRESKKQSHLLFNMHHILGDAWSFNLLVGEFIQVYDQLKKGNFLLDPKPDYNLEEYFKAEKELSEKNEKAHLVYWKSIFKQTRMVDSTDDLSTNKKSSEMKKIFEATFLDSLESKCTEKGISLYQLLLTVYIRSIARVLNIKQVLVNTAVHGRDFPVENADRMIALFARNLPVLVETDQRALSQDLSVVTDSLYQAVEHGNIPQTQLMQLFVKYTERKMEDFFRYYFTYMIFNSLSKGEGKELNADWGRAEFEFNSGAVNSHLFLGVRVSKNLQINLGGKLLEDMKAQILSEIKGQLENFIYFENKIRVAGEPDEINTYNIDSALIAYLPSKRSVEKMLRKIPGGEKLIQKLVDQLFPEEKPIVFEIEKNQLGASAVIMLPLFAEDINSIQTKVLLQHLKLAIQQAHDLDIHYLSLAGNLPSRTNYAVSLRDKLFKGEIAPANMNITTGHATTVVAVVKTIEKTLKMLVLRAEEIKIGVAGFGSIGQTSLRLLLRKIGIPAEIRIADLANKIPALESQIGILQTEFNANVITCAVEDEIPDCFYDVDLIIGATSNGEVLKIDKLKSGTIIVDDSFPAIVSYTKAISRMKKEKDVLIIGGGLLQLKQRQRVYVRPELQGRLMQTILKNYGDFGIPGCRLESLLIAGGADLPITQGLVDDQRAIFYWEKINKLGLEAAEFHFQNYLILPETIDNMKKIFKSKKPKTAVDIRAR
jgi:amino acid adenylation domain-containing protein